MSTLITVLSIVTNVDFKLSIFLKRGYKIR